MKTFFPLLVLVFLVGCGEQPPEKFAERPFADLPNWTAETVRTAAPAFLKSCDVFQKKKGNLHAEKIFGTAEQWQALCDDLRHTDIDDLKQLFERRLKVIEILPEEGEKTLFTGYYTPEIKGSFERRPGYNVPLYRKPQDLLTADLGAFFPDLKGQQLVARVEGQKIVPYPARAQLQQHLKNRHVLLWLKNPADAFFLHIQGSGRVQLPNGKTVRVGYAGNNGHPYTAIGKVMIQKGLITREEATLPGLKKWLKDNPKKSADIYNANARYIFFALTEKQETGALGVPLTSGASLAVDRSVLPLGIPVFVSTTEDATGKPFNRLMMAQDVGSAIKGRVRGDIYFGVGVSAEEKAGEQRSGGQLFALVPR